MAAPTEGDAVTPAQSAVSYYDSDFTWESLRDKVQPLVTQLEAAAAAAASDCCDGVATSGGAGGAADGGAATSAVQYSTCDNSWEAFHQRHSSAKFFKPKRYLYQEFPQLAAPNVRIVDIGAGNGASILPVLAGNATARAICCDVSATALRLLQTAADEAGVARDRLQTAVLDAADALNPAPPLLAQAAADAVLLVFALSAVSPGRMAAVLALAHAVLRPGGLLLFRDYALYDMPMLRFAPQQMLAPRLFRREDGTLAYFFTTEDLTSRAAAARFAPVECSYACVNNVNRKNATVLQRAFVHGVFKKAER